MHLLVFLSHPAQFLFFKNSIHDLKARGHKVTVLIKTKDILEDLLKAEGIPYENILPEVRGSSKLSILWSLFKRDVKLNKYVKKHKPDLMMGSDASLAHVGKLRKIPVVTTLEDDYSVIRNLARLTYPYTHKILVPNVCDVGKWSHKKIGYDGYMKLAWLHPNNFKPDINKIGTLGHEKYFLVRLSALGAHHDFKVQGVSDDFLRKIIQKLETRGTVFISSEKPLKAEFEKLRLQIPVSEIHHYLYYAQMLICDSQSMAVEAAVLGTPGIRISSFKGRISVLEELEQKYGLTYGFLPESEDEILKKIDALSSEDMKETWQQKRDKMLSEKIDVRAYLTNFIENFMI